MASSVSVQCMCSYAVDSYQALSGEAIVTVILIRNTTSFVASYGITPLVINLGFQISFIVVSAQDVVHSATVLLMISYGKALRTNSAPKYAFLRASHADGVTVLLKTHNVYVKEKARVTREVKWSLEKAVEALIEGIWMTARRVAIWTIPMLNASMMFLSPRRFDSKSYCKFRYPGWGCPIQSNDAKIQVAGRTSLRTKSWAAFLPKVLRAATRRLRLRTVSAQYPGSFSIHHRSDSSKAVLTTPYRPTPNAYGFF